MNSRGFALPLLFCVFLVRVVLATDQEVIDSGDNGGANQLRAKLAAVQASGGGKVTFNIGTATITLTQGLLVDTGTNVTIDGGGKVTISGNNATRILVVRSGATLTLRNLILTRALGDSDGGAVSNSGTLNALSCKFIGNQVPLDFSGGAILSLGPLNLTNCEFAANKGGGGGAIYPRYSAAITTITGCNFHDNEADNISGGGLGGALLLWDGARVTVANSSFSRNQAAANGRGGAISVTANSELIVTGSAFAQNSAPFAGAAYNGGSATFMKVSFENNGASTGVGGVFNSGNGFTTLSDVTFTGNHSHFCGALYNPSGCTVSLMNVTISANSSDTDAAGIYTEGSATLTNVTLSENNAGGSGGAIFFNAGTATLTNVTLSGNSAAVNAGGIYKNTANPGTLTLKNTLIATGTSGANSNVPLGGSFNLSDDGTCGFAAGGGRDNVPNLLLGQLLNNGGFTKTQLPQPGSAAIDAGTASGAPARDQRGYLRVGAAVDVGAAEFAGYAPTRSDFDANGLADYLLFNASSRASAIWYLNGNVFVSGRYGPALPPGWTLAGSADFDGNGSPDYLLVNGGTRQTAVWYLNNATFVSGSLGPILPSGWNLVAAVDINLDGWPDYLFFNPTTRQTAVWYLKNTTYISAALGPTLPVGWALVDALDFNGNARPDYLLYKPSTRQSAIWYLNGTALVNGSSGPTLPAGWTLQGASEFNADGSPDYVLFEPSTQRTAIWYLNGATPVRGVFGPTLATGYVLAAP